MSTDQLGFRSGVVKPIECLNGGWALIKGQFWLALGVTLVGTLIASLAPFGILIGPMFIGIYLYLIRVERGEKGRFDDLFKGFEKFVDGLVATLFLVLPMIVILVPGYLAMFGVIFAAAPPGGGKPNPNMPVIMLGAMAAFMALVFAVQLAVSVLFFFSFQLIADRGLTGIEAVKLSVKAARANLGGVFLLVLLTMFLSFVGLLACYVGAFFVMPIHFAANLYAYRQVFPKDAVLGEPADGNALDYMDN